MAYVVKGLSAGPYRHLYGLAEQDLHDLGVRRYRADVSPGFPDRIEMRDARPGETLLLINHVSLPHDTPYRASHAIFVREGAEEAYVGENEIPEVMAIRPLSLRAFDGDGFMRDAILADGLAVEPAIERLFENGQVAFIHAHNATRGCYAGLIERLG